jgi:hypothetical protein
MGSNAAKKQEKEERSVASTHTGQPLQWNTLVQDQVSMAEACGTDYRRTPPSFNYH